MRLCILILLVASNASAAAWLQPKGYKLRITSFGYYKADNYKKNYFEIYGEYGKSYYWTVGSKAAYEAIKLDDYSLDGVSYLEWFARRHIYLDDKYSVVSNFSLRLPAIKKPILNLALSNSELELSGGLAIGRGYKKGYVETAIDYHTGIKNLVNGNRGEESYVHIDFSSGYNFNSLDSISLSAYSKWNLGNKKPHIFYGQTSDTAKLQLAYKRQITDSLAYQIGVNKDVYTSNSAKGSSIFAGVWYGL
jgi:hypothetical protein